MLRAHDKRPPLWSQLVRPMQMPRWLLIVSIKSSYVETSLIASFCFILLFVFGILTLAVRFIQMCRAMQYTLSLDNIHQIMFLFKLIFPPFFKLKGA